MFSFLLRGLIRDRHVSSPSPRVGDSGGGGDKAPGTSPPSRFRRPFPPPPSRPASVLPLILVAVAGSALALFVAHAVRHAGRDRIVPGMRLAEVEALLGRKADWWIAVEDAGGANRPQVCLWDLA